MSKYPEIQALQKIIHDFDINIKVLENVLFESSDHVWVEFTINKESFTLFIDDEYEDLKIDNPPLHLCLVLRELETYQDEDDILKWANLKGLDAGNSKVLNYYKNLVQIYLHIEQIIGTIDSQISDLDFQLNAGDVQELRK